MSRSTSAKGLHPKAAAHITQTDHRRQIEAAEVRLRKKRTSKLRRFFDKKNIEGDEIYHKDVHHERFVRHFT